MPTGPESQDPKILGCSLELVRTVEPFLRYLLLIGAGSAVVSEFFGYHFPIELYAMGGLVAFAELIALGAEFINPNKPLDK